MELPRLVGLLGLASLLMVLPAVFSSPAAAQIGIGISVRIGPPALPVYEQPQCPSEGYLWTPGYWAWDDDNGYYWVPGTWVEAPEPGLLWTPGYWGWNDGAYAWNDGYWGPQVGFYGGIAIRWLKVMLTTYPGGGGGGSTHCLKKSRLLPDRNSIIKRFPAPASSGRGAIMASDPLANMVERSAGGCQPRKVGHDLWESKCPGHGDADHALALAQVPTASSKSSAGASRIVHFRVSSRNSIRLDRLFTDTQPLSIHRLQAMEIQPSIYERCDPRACTCRFARHRSRGSAHCDHDGNKTGAEVAMLQAGEPPSNARKRRNPFCSRRIARAATGLRPPIRVETMRRRGANHA